MNRKQEQATIPRKKKGAGNYSSQKKKGAGNS